MTPDSREKAFQQAVIFFVICLFGLVACVTHLWTPENILMVPVYCAIILFSILSLCLALLIFYILYREHVSKNEDMRLSKFEDANEVIDDVKSYGNASRKRKFLSHSEREFKERLQEKLPPNIEIHCKAQLRDVLESEIADALNYDNKKDRQIGMMHLDYVLIDKKTERVILVIELDGSSHSKYKAKWRDRLKNTILHQSSIPLRRVPDLPDAKKNHPAIIDNIVDFCENEIQQLKPTI